MGIMMKCIICDEIIESDITDYINNAVGVYQCSNGHNNYVSISIFAFYLDIEDKIEIKNCLKDSG